jgi:hypothetical protein
MKSSRFLSLLFRLSLLLCVFLAAQSQAMAASGGTVKLGASANPPGIIESMKQLPGFIWDSFASDEVGVFDSERMSRYYEDLLKLQGRPYDLGFLLANDRATQGMLMWEGFALSAATGPVVTLGGKLYQRMTGGKLAPVVEGAPNFQLVDVPYLKSSPTVVQGAKVSLSADVPLANGSVIPAGSIVTVNGNAMKVVLPNGTSYIANYSTSLQKLLPAPTGSVNPTTTLYRAVAQAELKQIQATGTFEAGANSLSGKWFAETADHARQWGNIMNGDNTSTIIKVQLPRNQADQLMRLERLDGIGPARYGELDQIRGATIEIFSP